MWYLEAALCGTWRQTYVVPGGSTMWYVEVALYDTLRQHYVAVVGERRIMVGLGEFLF